MPKVVLEDILNHYGLAVVKRTPNGGVLFCPFHDDGKKPACSVNFQKNVFHCFSCGAGGGIVKFVELKEGCNREEAHRILKRKFGAPFHENYQKNVDPEKEQNDLLALYEERLKVGMAYCKQTGINLKKLKKSEKGTWFGLLGWVRSKTAIDGASKLKYYYESEEGKKEITITLLVDKCLKEWRKIKKYTKERKKEYDSRPTMLKALENQIDIRADKMLLAKRKEDSDRFEVMRESFLEYYLVLKSMARQKGKWLKNISQVDWIKP